MQDGSARQEPELSVPVVLSCLEADVQITERRLTPSTLCTY
jgi:hypothetical protein